MFQAKLLLLTVVAVLVAAEYKIEPRIVQGQDALRGQFKFYVFLEMFKLSGMFGDFSMSRCGGSLISDQWVVTAAHCLRNKVRATVHLGSLSAVDESVGEHKWKVYADNFHMHPNYSRESLALNDIGLIKLPEPVTFSDVIKPIPFACSSSSDSGQDVIAIGNGRTNTYDPTLPLILQYVELKTISRLSCAKTYPFLISRESVICTKGEERRGICDGDSGGPLITSDNTLLGLSSFGSPRGCEVGEAQVFTRISNYASWIKDMSDVECKN